MNITEKEFGQGAILYRLENDNGYKIDVTNLGARIVAFYVPTRNGVKNIVLGFDSAEEYLQKDAYIGATIGRVAGRIKDGNFVIEGKPYHTTQNEKGNTLHGGPNNFETKLWLAETNQNLHEANVTFTYTSLDDEQGFPGNLDVKVTYTLTNDNVWQVEYEAKSDIATLFNPTNHVYFNLTGDVTQNVGDHTLQLASEKFAVVDADTLATGEVRSVAGTPFDFRRGEKVAQVFDTDYEQNTLVGGLDHPFFLEKAEPQAVLASPTEDIKVELLTDEPSVVIFTAQFDPLPEMHGQKLAYHGGLTLETQVSPGALEHGFGDIILPAHKTFKSQTSFKVTTH